METGIGIKKDLIEEWKQFAGNNTRDSYSFAAFHATFHTMQLLTDGKTPKEAETEGFKNKDLTGFLAGCAAKAVVYFHERGEEFNDYWNSKWGVSKEKAQGGTVNPAIMAK